jgi:hypothetical protein
MQKEPKVYYQTPEEEASATMKRCFHEQQNGQDTQGAKAIR